MKVKSVQGYFVAYCFILWHGFYGEFFLILRIQLQSNLLYKHCLVPTHNRLAFIHICEFML